MTMASSTAHPPPSRRQPGPSTTYQPLFTSPESTVTKFDVCYIDNKSSSIPSILREIPTRNSLPNSFNAVVDPLDDDDDECKTKTTTTLHPTYLEGNAASLPYQSGLAAINAAIAKMKQRNNNITLHPAHASSAAPTLRHPVRACHNIHRHRSIEDQTDDSYSSTGRTPSLDHPLHA